MNFNRFLSCLLLILISLQIISFVIFVSGSKEDKKSELKERIKLDGDKFKVRKLNEDKNNYFAPPPSPSSKTNKPTVNSKNMNVTLGFNYCYVSFHGGNQTKSPSNINVIYQFNQNGEFIGTPLNLGTLPNGIELREPRDFIFGPDSNLYIVNGYKGLNQILRFDTTSSISGNFVFAGIYTQGDNITNPGLSHPFAISFGPPNNTLYISNQDTNTVTRYYGPFNPTKLMGTPMELPKTLQPPYFPEGTFYPGTFVAPASKVGMNLGVMMIRGITFGPTDGLLYVSDELESCVKIFNPETGELVGTIKNENLLKPVHLLFSLDGTNLFIGSKDNNEIFVWNKPTNGFKTFVSRYNNGGLDGPGGMAFGNDGYLYVASRIGKQILRYSLVTGQPDKAFIENLPDSPEFLMLV